MRLGLTLCTRHRPVMVQACLRSICREFAGAELDVFIVVVENSSGKSLTDAFDHIVGQFPGVELYYELEPKVGIPLARNRAVDIALRNKADWIGFVDDDEELEAGWLAAMARAVHELDADALTGPVRTTFQADPPPWLKKRRLDQRAHGQTLETAATNNTLLNCSWLQRRHGALRFNEDLRYTGGSDTELFRRLTDQGGTIKWVENAIVRETVPQSRTTMSWNVRLKARTLANNARNYKDRKGALAAILRYFPSAVRRLVFSFPLLIAGVMCRPFSIRNSDRLVFAGLKSAAAAFGLMRGLLGWELEPYRTIEGY